MKDPQRWANKFFSQILHIVNSNAKGGLIAETGAFVDPKKAEEQWADPAAVVLLKNGGLNKVKERDAASFPQALDRLMQFAIQSIPATAGVNLETLGLQQNDQAGILEQERKKATIMVLSPFFDSLRRYRKEEGRLLVHFINEYISDGRLIRVKNEQGEQWVPLNRNEETLDYDIIVDEAPTSPNQKQEVWATMAQLLPQLLKEGMPLPPDFFDYSPLPSELAAKMKASMQQKIPPQLQAKMQEMGQELQKLSQENQMLKQDMTLDVHKQQSKDAQQQTQAMLKEAKLRADNEARMAELQAKNDQHIQKLMAQQQELRMQLASDQTQQQLDARVAAAEHALQRKQQEMDAWKAKLDSDTKLMIAGISADAKAAIATDKTSEKTPV